MQKTFLIFVFSLLFLLFVSFNVMANETSKDNLFKVNVDHLVVYDNSGGSLTPMGKLAKGQTYPYLNDWGNWYQLKFGDKLGYVYKGTNVSPSLVSPKNLNVTRKNSDLSFISSTDIVVYDNTSGSLVPYGVIFKNQNYPIIRDIGNWYEVDVAGRYGYIYKGDVKAISSSTSYFKVVSDKTPVYSDKNNTSSVKGYLLKNEIYKKESIDGNWIAITYGDGFGYISLDKTTPTNSQPMNVDNSPSSSRSILVNSPGIKVFDNSSGALVPFYEFSTNQSYPIVGTMGNWYKVNISNRLGYVYAPSVALEFNENDHFFLATDDIVVYDQHSNVLGKVLKNQTYPRTGEKDGYHTIQFSDKVGYVSKEKTLIGEESVLKNISPGNLVYTENIKAVSNTLIYENSNGNLVPYAEIQAGIHYFVVTNIGDWYEVEFSGRIGYIHKDDLQIGPVYKNTQYPYSLDEFLSSQMKVYPQTDKYRSKPGYIHSSIAKIIQGKTTDSSNLRTEPSISPTNIETVVSANVYLTVIDVVDGESIGGNNKWYKVDYNSKTLFIHSSIFKPTVISTTSGSNVRELPDTNSHIYTTVSSGTRFTYSYEVLGSIVSGNPNWYEVRIGTWRNAKSEDTLFYLDPKNFDPNTKSYFQFLLLSEPAGTNIDEINSKVLNGKGIFQNKASSFIQAAEKYKVNEVYLIAHALLETGNGSSTLATGVKVGKDASGNPQIVTSSNSSSLTDIKTTYNMYGIHAFDSCALECASEYAYTQGWFTPEAAIIGGAEWIGSGYIHHSTYQQNTLYKMRWNPSRPATHQYATDIGWAFKQVNTINNIYSLLETYSLVYDVPEFQP